jgi:hypothetical protein
LQHSSVQYLASALIGLVNAEEGAIILLQCSISREQQSLRQVIEKEAR